MYRFIFLLKRNRGGFVERFGSDFGSFKISCLQTNSVSLICRWVHAVSCSSAQYERCKSIDDRRDLVRKIITTAVLSIAIFGASSANAANIVETAQKAGTFGTLIAAAKAAGLAGALSNGKNLTVFAPTDTAFDKLPKGTVATLLKPENKAKLAAIISYHVLPRRLTSGQLPHKAIHVRTIKASGDRLLRVTKSRGGVTVDGANVVSANIRASNGIIHVIDKVMLPSN
jgi:uncharacterized surface protein with fasciclin (FAS1) repeats